MAPAAHNLDEMGPFRVELRPNRSMSPRGLAVVVICLSVVCLAIALGFLSMGFWLVLPFAGLEILVVGLAVGYTTSAGDDYEIVEVDGREVRVIRCERLVVRRQSFLRGWTRVELTPAFGLRPGRLHVGSHGRFVEIGRHATESARQELAVRLKRVLSAAA